jgi:esterase/lipase
MRRQTVVKPDDELREKGILLIHGLSGSPHELAPVDTALRNVGYHTRLVELPGHGDNPTRHFHETSAFEILDHVSAEYQALSREARDIYIVGHSLGGICTLLTAAVQPPQLKGAVVFAAPYEHAYFYNYLHGLARVPVPHLIRGLYYAPRHGIKVRRPEMKPWNMPKLLQQSRVIFSLMKEQIHNINVPVSLAHSLYDLTIPYPEMQKLADKIGKPGLVKTTTLTRSGHRIFPLSHDMDEALKVIFDFLECDCDAMAAAQSSFMQPA